MIKFTSTSCAACLITLSLCGGASAQAPAAPSKPHFQYARVATNDLEQTARFYEQTLELREIGRGASQNHGSYIELNAGDTLAAAKANTSAGIFIGQFRPDQTADTVAHLVFYVGDVYATVERAKNAGGVVAVAPYELRIADSVRIIAYLKDPGGNQIEILATKK